MQHSRAKSITNLKWLPTRRGRRRLRASLNRFGVSSDAVKGGIVARASPTVGRFAFGVA